MPRTADRYAKRSSDRRPGEVTYRAGNYLRLSVDSDYTGSDSLENQRKLAKEYVAGAPDLVIVKEYIDNGKSGTDFVRPAFMRMIADVKQKAINCVIVKDLSRFGRQCIEAGNYIEKVFPFLGVRFISIVDRYDSADPECDREFLLIALKNLIHEMYVKDISDKVGSTLRIKQEQGIFYRSATVPYGYRMDPDNRNYCIDEPAAEIVRQIFSLYDRERSKYAVCRYLYENRILPPGQYRKTGSIYQESGEALRSWHLSTIDRILRNPVYIGNILRHKTEPCLFDGKKPAKAAKEEIVLLAKNHQPIISEFLFDAVQRKREEAKRNDTGFRRKSVAETGRAVPGGTLFHGKIFCGDCGAAMTRSVKYRVAGGNRIRYAGFQCSSHRRIPGCCDSGEMGEAILCDILRVLVQKHLSLIKGLKKRVENSINDSFGGRLRKLERETQRNTNDYAVLQQEYLLAYERHVSGELSADRFQTFRQSYRERTALYKFQEKLLKDKRKKIAHDRTTVKKMIAAWMQQGSGTEPAADMIWGWAARVEVLPGKRLFITLCYRDCFAAPENRDGEA